MTVMGATVVDVLELVRSGKLYIVKASKGGSKRKYSYISIPHRLAEALGIREGTRLKAILADKYVDFIVSEEGDYIVHRTGRALRVRIPVDVDDYVAVTPLGRGFRAYY